MPTLSNDEAEGLRAQLRAILDENARLRLELDLARGDCEAAYDDGYNDGAADC